MEKEQILQSLSDERERFLDLIEDLSDEDLQEPGVTGDWSVKDIIAHLSMWEAELIKLLWQAKDKRKPSTAHFSADPVDALNARWRRELQSRPLERVLADFHAVRNQTILRVEAFSNKDLADPDRYPWLQGRPLGQWIEADSFGHEAEHAGQVRAWREQREKGV